MHQPFWQVNQVTLSICFRLDVWRQPDLTDGLRRLPTLLGIVGSQSKLFRNDSREYFWTRWVTKRAFWVNQETASLHLLKGKPFFTRKERVWRRYLIFRQAESGVRLCFDSSDQNRRLWIGSTSLTSVNCSINHRCSVGRRLLMLKASETRAVEAKPSRMVVVRISTELLEDQKKCINSTMLKRNYEMVIKLFYHPPPPFTDTHTHQHTHAYIYI